MAVVGDRYWVPHEEHAWICGKVTKIEGQSIEFGSEIGRIVLKNSGKLEPCGTHVDDNVENLVDLDELSEGAILHHVRKRFKNKQIYTHVGAILVAVNPFESLNIYGENEVKKASNVVNVYPHVFITASIAYQQLRMNLKNQSVLISGESGAGKTETTKKVLNYLANVAPGSKPRGVNEPGVEEKILQSNPLLEALGNAKTLRNDNSSRFGKWMKVDFDHNFRIQGCEIVNYLLEKSRVVKQSKNERNYHIFYQLLAGIDDTTRQAYGLQSPEFYHYLNTTGCYSIQGVNDCHDFKEVRAAMNTLQFSQSLQTEMLNVIIAILLLGNVRFDEGPLEDTSQVSQSSAVELQRIAFLLGLSLDSFKYALTEKRVQMGRGSVVSIKLDPIQAVDSKDTLSKALYSNMFDWVISKINETLRTQAAPFSIGILDIFGFEVFDVNSFEQLCINYANEKLQYHFNEVIFSEEMKMYAEEGVPSEAITFIDNGECVNLIEGKIGLLSLLDEECSLGKATDLTYASKIDQAFGKNKQHENAFFTKHKTKPEAFIVHHFAGAVEYVTHNFLEKNKDNLSATLQEVMQLSTVGLIPELFATDADSALQRRVSAQKQKAQTGKSTLGGQFRNQLIGLVNNLRLTEPHFIRCVKPNHQKKPGIFDGQLALRQLRYAGLFEAIRIRQSGFAYRVAHNVFAKQYATLVDGISSLLRNNNIAYMDAAVAILEDATKNAVLEKQNWVVGKSKVFIKTSQHRLQLERQRIKRVEVFAIRLQQFARIVIKKIRANQKKYEEIRERQRLEAEMKRKSEAIVKMQAIGRGYVIRKAMALIAELINLRRALAKRNVQAIEAVLQRIESLNSKEKMSAIFKTEVDIAKTMVKLIKIQDRFIRDIEKAMDAENVPDLNRLLVKCDRLDLGAHPSVEKARNLLSLLHRKKKVMKTMIDFLRNENDNCEVIPETLEMAVELHVDPDFIAQVRRIYESASPRLRARNNLRRAIETLDREAVILACKEAEALREHHSNFAEMEMRSAKNLLNLIELEEELCRRPISASSARLSDEVLGICHEYCAATDKATQKSLKQRLFEIAGSQERFEILIRSYKWSKICCTWKYPEVLDPDRKRGNSTVAHDDMGEFFGLRPAEARSSIHVICTLHQDIDPTFGEDAPASLQAALGALELIDEKPKQKEYMTEYQRRAKERREELESSKTGRIGDKMIRKAATPTTRKSIQLKNIAGRRTSYFFLPENLEEQLLQSRSSLSKQQKSLEITKKKMQKEKHKEWR